MRRRRHIVTAVFLAALALAAARPVMADMTPNAASLLSDEWQEYCDEFLDMDTNNGWAAPACNKTVDGKIPDGDIDVEALFRPTIALDDPDTYKATSRLLLYLAQPEVKEAIPADVLDASVAHERILRQQSINAARSIAFHVLSEMTFGRRAPIGTTPDEQTASAAPLPPLPPVSPPPPIPANVVAPPPPLPPPPARFDIAVGDGIAGVLQKQGHLDGGQCPDNNKHWCTTPSGGKSAFYNCDPAKNLKGGTCISRPAQGVLNTINDMIAADSTVFNGKNVLLSSGLSNQTTECTGGPPWHSDLLEQQIDALLGAGAAHIVVVGAYIGQTRGENPIDMNNVNFCIQQTVAGRSEYGSTVNSTGGFSSDDHLRPVDADGYFQAAVTELSRQGATISTTNAPAQTCADGTPGPYCTP